MRPIRISQLKTGDEFFTDVSGTKVRCEALENCQENDVSYTVHARTPMGDRELHEAKGGRVLRLYVNAPEVSAPPGG